MKILDYQTNLSFVPQPNEYHLVLDDQMPSLPLVTSAFGLIFQEDRFLMTKLVKRGWDIPGGMSSQENHRKKQCDGSFGRKRP